MSGSFRVSLLYYWSVKINIPIVPEFTRGKKFLRLPLLNYYWLGHLQRRSKRYIKFGLKADISWYNHPWEEIPSPGFEHLGREAGISLWIGRCWYLSSELTVNTSYTFAEP